MGDGHLGGRDKNIFHSWRVYCDEIRNSIYGQYFRNHKPDTTLIHVGFGYTKDWSNLKDSIWYKYVWGKYFISNFETIIDYKPKDFLINFRYGNRFDLNYSFLVIGDYELFYALVEDNYKLVCSIEYACDIYKIKFNKRKENGGRDETEIIINCNSLY